MLHRISLISVTEAPLDAKPRGGLYSAPQWGGSGGIAALQNQPLDALDSLHLLLRHATHAAHVRLNHHSLLRDLTKPGLAKERYLRVLVAYHRLYAWLEPLIEKMCNGSRGYSYVRREKLPWLRADLEHFGVDISQLPTPALEPWRQLVPTSSGDLAGMFYVIEGSTLGGRVISRSLQRFHGWSAQAGARFFNGYGVYTEARWSEYVTWLESVRADARESGRALEAAVQFFRVVEETLDAHA